MKNEKSKITGVKENLTTKATGEDQPLTEQEMEEVTGGLGNQSFQHATDATNVLKDLAGKSDPKPLNKGVMGN